jgi:hypothetical protein
MKRRRSIIKIIALLAVGATLNVAVAWACAYWIDSLGFAENGGACLGSFRTCTEISEYPPEIRLIVKAQEASTNIRITRFTHEMWTDAHGLPMCAMSSRAFVSPQWTTNYSGIYLGPYLDAHADGLPLTLTPWEQHVLVTRQIPLRPIWPGFAVNTLFYAGVLWVLFCGPFALRRMIRRRRGRCAACAYPIGQSPVCTECGSPHAVTPKTNHETSIHKSIHGTIT